MEFILFLLGVGIASVLAKASDSFSRLEASIKSLINFYEKTHHKDIETAYESGHLNGLQEAKSWLNMSEHDRAKFEAAVKPSEDKDNPFGVKTVLLDNQAVDRQD